MNRFISIFPLFWACQAGAQEHLTPGDQLPNLHFEQVINTTNGSLSLGDLHGKAIILDFWDIYCKGCIASFPKMQAIQNRFGDSLQIVLVTFSPLDKVKELLARNGMDKTIHLPIIASDTVLTRLFEFRTVPTHAWVNAEGTIRYFSNGYETTEQLVANFLEGKDLPLLNKKEYRDFKFNIPLILDGKGRQIPHLRYYSMIFEHVDDEGSRGVSKISLPTGLTSLQSLNLAIPELYKYAWAELLDPKVYTGLSNYANLIIDVPDLRPFIFKEGLQSQWIKDHTYSYESLIPATSADSIWAIMRRDLNQFFGLRTSLEEKYVECLVLSQAKGKDALLSKTAYVPFLPDNDSLFVMAHTDLYFLFFKIGQLSYRSGGIQYPIFNDTGYKMDDKIDVHLQGNLKNMEGLCKALKSQGLELAVKPRKIKVLHITKQ